jgi:hypothetical protein
MAVDKYFHLTEQVRLRGEMQAVNIFNHPNWSNPATNISQLASVGVISGVGGVFDMTGARVFSLSVRLEW